MQIVLRILGMLLFSAYCHGAVDPNAAKIRSGADCRIGIYRLKNGDIVDVAASNNDTLRWRRFDGSTGALHKTKTGAWTSTAGWTDRADGKTVMFGECAKNSMEFAGVEGKRIGFDVHEGRFDGHGITLAGRLVMPLGENKIPIVVLVHGSERDSALETFALQRLLPAYGVGAYVYDKRGTGQSQGIYTQDFSVLADDAVEAMREARRIAGPRLARIGYHGGSQGGWVAPLAANRASVDFVIAAFALAVSVIEEDRQEVAIEMREKGWSGSEIDAALEVARAAEVVAASHFTQGFTEFAAVRDKYHNAPWYKDLHGNYTYLLLPYTEAQLRELAKTEFSFTKSTPFAYDPMPALRASTVPQLWILGGEDYEAPSTETSSLIKGLIASAHPFTLAYYPTAEHGMTQFELSPHGERISTRYAPGYFKLIRDFARDGRLTGRYGDAELSPSRKQP